MNYYKVLGNQVFSSGKYSLVPIRFEDRYKIMQWRNEQIYHLRQNKPLSKADQDHYFSHVIDGLFEQEEPNQILFSFLENEKCIGYGGLVHINWIDKNAEVSFIMDTTKEKEIFQKLWNVFLEILKEVAFEELKLHKTFVYAFDLRPHLYEALQTAGYILDARLKEHCCFNGDYIDVVIYSKVNEN